MTPQHNNANYMHRRPAAAAAIYLVVIALLFTIAPIAWVSLAESYTARDTSLQRLASLEQRRSPAAPSQSSEEIWPPGSPTLGGATVTIASANLLQHLATAITAAEGSLLSSELEAAQSDPKDNVLKATATFEIKQSALQKVLYDLEAGMPFLFVDQLAVTPTADDARKLRVVMRVSGFWSETK
jgi:general secretion pathway protein M